MILLLSSAACSRDRVKALQHETGELIDVVCDVNEARKSLRRRAYKAIVIDHVVVDSRPAILGSLLSDAGAAVPVYLNLAISSSHRLAVEIKNALRRRRTEKNIATGADCSDLRDELRDALTGILLSSELALAVPSVPPDAAAKIEQVRELAESMRRHLEM